MADIVALTMLIVVAGAILRFVFQFRKLRAQDHMIAKNKPLGMEATDLDRFALERGPEYWRNNQNNRLEKNLDHAATRQQALARVLNPVEKHVHQSAQESAIRLVKGIAIHNPVVLFMDGKASTTQDRTAQLICDLLNTLEVSFKDVDVPADPDMHLGLPQRDGSADLPYLYIDGAAVGCANDVLAMAQTGALQDVLAKGKISHNMDAARALITEPRKHDT